MFDSNGTRADYVVRITWYNVTGKIIFLPDIHELWTANSVDKVVERVTAAVITGTNSCQLLLPQSIWLGTGFDCFHFAT